MTNLPYILSAKTYFWTPSSHASSRRSNEKRRYQEVADFFTLHGFTKVGDGTFEKGDCRVFFSYSESCKNVYKSFSVTIKGKKSNSRGLQKYL